MKRFVPILLCAISICACKPDAVNEEKPVNTVVCSCKVNGVSVADGRSIGNVDASSVTITLEFSSPLDLSKLDKNKIFFAGSILRNYTAELQDEYTLSLKVNPKLEHFSSYTLMVDKGDNLGVHLPFAYTYTFITAYDPSPKFPAISDEELMDLVQRRTFSYFWDYAHPVSGLARERLNSDETVTTGGSGFGFMAILAGIERGFISREEGYNHMLKVVNFLSDKAVRHHGAFPHWMNGSTGGTKAFSTYDNGADLVETAFLMEGLIACRQYFSKSSEAELRTKITSLWKDVEWDWFLNGTKQLYWHWSPDYGWHMNMAVKGWNEALMVYLLAASSPTHTISKEVYDKGWASNGGMKNGRKFYGITLPLGPDYGGPLFFTHYSFLGLDPRNLSDSYASYWDQNAAHAKINHAYCVDNPNGYIGYSADCWGLTASDYPGGYIASSPTKDKGTIAPTAAIASMPYTPTESMAAMKYFYYVLGDKLFGEYGFHDSFSLQDRWFAKSYIAIDQGPIVVMIENHRSGIIWDSFMKDPDVRAGLTKLGFTYNKNQ